MFCLKHLLLFYLKKLIRTNKLTFIIYIYRERERERERERDELLIDNVLGNKGFRGLNKMCFWKMTKLIYNSLGVVP